MIHFISDTHFGHANIIALSKRPFKDLEEMNETLTKNWNEAVQPDDTIIHLGDFAMGPKVQHPNFFRRLNGYKVLVRGNHDQSEAKMLAMGWNEVCVRRYMELDGKRLYLSHIPVGNDRPETPDRYYKPEFIVPPTEPFDFWLCGHVHNSWKRRGNIINVGVDQWGYRPSTLQRLLTESQETDRIEP